MKNFKQRLQRGETLIGGWLNLGNSVTAEILGLAGFDWVLIDLEHGTGMEAEVLHQLQALEHTPAAALVRVESAKRQRIHRILDMGAEGIMCPRISTIEEATEAASSLHYPPEGSRGIAKMVRATGFSPDFSNYYKKAMENIVGIVQVETVGILPHLDAVAALPGVDALFIGPSDLSMALGIFGQLDHPLFKDALRATVSAAQKHNKAVGTLIGTPDEFKTYHDMGIRMIACGADSGFVAEGARGMAGKLNAARGGLII
jgi:4-hydroxy-2-oxoheptanedioate aldolase